MAKVRKRVVRPTKKKKGSGNGREEPRALSAETIAKLDRIASAAKKA